jgi:hypothetical protein
MKLLLIFVQNHSCRNLAHPGCGKPESFKHFYKHEKHRSASAFSHFSTESLSYYYGY